MAEAMKQYFCNGVCQRQLNEDNFYKSNNMEKYGANDGKLFKCKKCSTMGLDNWEPETYLPLLEECDVPYVPTVWNDLLRRYCKDPSKVTGMTVIGRYLGTMHLRQWNKYRWADTDYLLEVERNKKEIALRQQGKAESEVQAAIAESERAPEKPAEVVSDPTVARNHGWKTADEVGLTEEDVNYLTIKWGSTYRPEEWVKLEQLWNEMNESYDIQTAGERDTLKMICKTSLKAHQLIDINDK